MITIEDKTFKSDITLASILEVKTKADMMGICKKLDLYVSPNLKKEETARRLAREILQNPINVLETLCKSELQLLDEFVKAGHNAYIVRKMRKTEYKLQKYSLVLTYEDFDNLQWHMLMPDSVRQSLQESYHFYLDMAEKGVKAPSAKQLRMMAALNELLGNGEY